jgi:hypothetical protein
MVSLLSLSYCALNLKRSKIPILMIIGDNDVMPPQARHGVQHQYPDLAVNYTTVENSRRSLK